MKKHNYVVTFEHLDDIEACLESRDIEAAQDAVEDLREHLEQARDSWWSENQRTFSAVRKLLYSFYAHAWSPRFARTPRLESALSFFTNQLLDQFILGGDPNRDQT